MKKRLILSLIAGVLMITSAMPVFAAPKQMADGNMFDVEYYATSNPDVASVFGTDETMLYSHYINCGKIEGRKPYADGSCSLNKYWGPVGNYKRGNDPVYVQYIYECNDVILPPPEERGIFTAGLHWPDHLF